MYKILTASLLSLVSFSGFAFHPAPNPETMISLDSICSSVNDIFDRDMKIHYITNDPSRGNMQIDLAHISGKIHTIRVGHKNTIIGKQDITPASIIPDVPRFKLYRSRLNVQAMISLASEPDVYYGVRLLDESPCSLNELGRFNLLQTAYENGLAVSLKVAKIRPFRSPIAMSEEGYVMEDYNLKYGYILDVEITDPAPSPPLTIADVTTVENGRTSLALAAASIGLVLGAGLVGFLGRRS